MHILYLHQYFVPPDGSGGTRSYEMARRLVKQGHEVTIVTSSAFFPSNYKFEQPITELEIDGIKIKVLFVSYSNKLSFKQRIRAFISFALKSISATFAVRKVDVILATSTPLTIALPGILAKFKHRCPMVFEVRDLWPELPIAVGALRNPLVVAAAKLFEKIAYKNSRRVIALSPGMAEGVARTGYPLNRIKVIPNSCDVALFRNGTVRSEDFLAQYPYLKGGPLVVYAGTLGVINGVEFMVKLAAEVMRIRPEIRFLIAGDGQEKEKIEAKAAKLGVLGKNLWMISPILKKDMPGMLAASTVSTSLFVDLPPMWNNSANKFFDTLAAGRPVIINYRGWQADFLKESGSGLVVSSGDIKAAAEELCDFVFDQDRLDIAKAAALKASDTVFNRDLLARELGALLEDVVAVK